MARFPLLGGDPAVDFVNTVPMKAGAPDDRLTRWPDVEAWAVAVGLMPARLPATDGDAAEAFQTAVRLRTGLAAAFEAAEEGAPPPPRAVSAINHALHAGPTPQRLRTEEGRLRLVSTAPATPAQLVAEIARRGAALLSSPEAERLRRCQGGDCVLWFVDRTRNRSRAWCSMETCGARAKAAAYYRRRKGNQPAA